MATESQRAALCAESTKCYRSSVSRHYYAAYQAVTSVLLCAGNVPPAAREAWSHEATPTLLEQHFDKYISARDDRQKLSRQLNELTSYVSWRITLQAFQWTSGYPRPEGMRIAFLKWLQISFPRGSTLSKEIQVEEWLQKEAEHLKIRAQFHMELLKRDNGWLYIPVFIADDMDAYAKASLLQDLEDAWNDQEPVPDTQLLLIPAAN